MPAIPLGAVVIECCKTDTIFNDFATLIAISPSSSQDLVVSQFPSVLPPHCTSERYFRGWDYQEGKAVGKEHSVSTS